MKVQFFPDEDMLYLGLADAESTEGAEVSEGIVFHCDVEGRLVSIEIDEASRRVNLDDIRDRRDLMTGTAGPPGRVLTTVEVAEELGVTLFAVQKIRKAMREAGVEVGLRPDLPDSLLSGGGPREDPGVEGRASTGSPEEDGHGLSCAIRWAVA